MKYFTLFFFAMFLLAACTKDDDGPTLDDQLREAIERNPAQHAADIQLIQDYLAAEGITAQSTSSGLHYVIETAGVGDHPGLNAVVAVFYKGYFLDGDVFDQTNANPVSFPLKNVILGWQEGIQLFKKDGKGKLFLPSALAYGSNPPPGIPANAVLAFDVELVDF